MSGAAADVIEGVLRGLAAGAPGLLAAIAQSGAQSDEEAIRVAREAAEKLPVRGGAGGAWAADLEERKRRGGPAVVGELATGAPMGEVPTASIVVNGRTVEAPRELTYEAAVALARLSGTPTVTFRRPATGGGLGELRPGQRIVALPGTVIDVTHTDGA